MATKRAIAIVLVLALLWPTAARAGAAMDVLATHARMVLPGTTMTEPGVFIPEAKVEKLTEDLLDYESLKKKYAAVMEEREKLLAQVGELKSADQKQQAALQLSDDREKLRQEMFEQMKQALELNTKTLQNTKTALDAQVAVLDAMKAFTTAQQKEIESLRTKEIWLMVFGGLASLAFGALLLFK